MARDLPRSHSKSEVGPGPGSEGRKGSLSGEPQAGEDGTAFLGHSPSTVSYIQQTVTGSCIDWMVPVV